MNLSGICRCCLIAVEKEPIDLTESLYKFLESDLGLQDVPRQHDLLDLPNSICLSCYRSIVTFERFYVQCRHAQEFLKSKLNDVLVTNDIYCDTECENYATFDIQVIKNDNDNLETFMIDFPPASDMVESGPETVETIEVLHPPNEKEHGKDDDNSVESTELGPPEGKIKSSGFHVCKVCGKEFYCIREWRKHEMTHPGLRPYVCQVCGVGFKDRTAINYHMTTHYGKTFNCNVCQKKCATRALLRLHIRCEHNNQQYQCEQCGETFKTSHLLKCHKSKHNGTPQFVCDFCTNAYYSRRNLLSHVNDTHIYYTCELCHTTYKKLIKITNHLKTDHAITENKEEHFTKKYSN